MVVTMPSKSLIEEKVSAFVKDPVKLKNTSGILFDFIFDAPLEKLIPTISGLPPISILDQFTKKKDRLQTLLNLDISAAYPYQTISEGIEPETESAITEFVGSLEVYPSKKLLVDLLGQKAIQDIIANILESGIIEFNKKTNPLFGMIQATGLDKQIKSFINLFLPNFLPKIADFLHATSFQPNSSMPHDICLLILHAQFTEVTLPNSEQLEKAEVALSNLIDRLKNDKKLSATTSNLIQQLQNSFLNLYGKQTLKEFLNLNEVEYSDLKNIGSEYLVEQILNYHKKNAIDSLLTSLIEEIMN